MSTTFKTYIRAKEMFRWKKIEKKLPDTTRQVFALVGSSVHLSHYRDGQWWWTKTIPLGGVSRWMEIPGEPKDFDYWLKCLREWWGRRVVQAQETSDYFTGWRSRNAQLSTKIVYYTNAAGEIRMGAPENFPVSKGFTKVVCNSTAEAERWSDRLRQYNIGKESKIDEKRAQIEGEFAKEHRRQIHNLISSSRSKYGRVFLENHLRRMDAAESKRHMSREEYNHNEGFERGR